MSTQKEGATEAHIHSPFDQPQNADIILRSSNGEDFHTQRVLLSLASDVFESMFTLPQAHREPEGKTPQDDPPIDLAEESNTIYQLLRWVDPRCTPSLELEDVQVALSAADKYNMQGVVQHVGQVLMQAKQHIHTDPIRMYAIAIRFGFHALARDAAKESLHLSLEERAKINIPEFAFISAQALQHLNTYYFACAQAACEVSTDPDFRWLDGATQEKFTQAGFSHGCVLVPRGNGSPWFKWWVDYMRLATRELCRRPRGSTVQDAQRFAVEPLLAAAACGACRLKAFPALLNIGGVFAAEVEERISKVCIFKLCLPLKYEGGLIPFVIRFLSLSPKGMWASTD